MDREQYNAYMREYLLRRYHTRMAYAKEQLGGKCTECGVTEELQFDHIDPKNKSFTIGNLWSVSKVRFEAELEKCQLLCRACHLKKTSKEQSVRHGEGKTGKKNCYCAKCAPLKRQYNRQWKKNNRIASEWYNTLGL